MEIIQISDYYNTGDGHPMNNITERLSSRGHDVKVYTSTLSVTPEGDKDSPNIEIRRFKGIEIAGKAIYPGLIMKLLFQRNPDVIHSWVSGFFSTFVTGYLKKIKKYPLVVVPDFDIVGPDPSLIKKPYFWFYRKVPTDMADVVLTFTEQEKKELTWRFGIKKEKIEVLPIGINYEEFSLKPKKNLRKELGLEDKFIILNVNYVVPKKNLEMIIRAMGQINQDNVIFLHVGEVLDKEYKKSLIKLTKDLKLTEKVKFIGKVDRDELYDYFKIADVFVQAGFRESYAIPILEAMAAGLPVVTTEVGIANEVIIDDKTGYLISGENEMVEKLGRLIQGRTLRKNMGKECKKVAKNYDWEIVIDKLEDIYKNLRE